MFIITLLLGCLVIIETCNLLIRLIKIIPPQDPPLDDYILKTMYA